LKIIEKFHAEKSGKISQLFALYWLAYRSPSTERERQLSGGSMQIPVLPVDRYRYWYLWNNTSTNQLSPV